MRKAGRPSNSSKRLKDGYYMLITVKNSKKPIRIMRETLEEVKQAEKKFNTHNFKYLGQVKAHFWIDGDNKGKPTT